MRWADLFSIEVPQDLYNEIEKQRQACEKIIGYKDKLIGGERASGLAGMSCLWTCVAQPRHHVLKPWRRLPSACTL